MKYQSILVGVMRFNRCALVPLIIIHKEWWCSWDWLVWLLAQYSSPSILCQPYGLALIHQKWLKDFVKYMN